MAVPKDKPNPGSDEALDLGCSCPVLDNHHGLGAQIDPKTGKVMFWYTEGCPVHSLGTPPSHTAEQRS